MTFTHFCVIHTCTQQELLLEAAIRRDVCQALSMRSMTHILAAFSPDEYAADGVAPGILDALREEAVGGFGCCALVLVLLSSCVKCLVLRVEGSL